MHEMTIAASIARMVQEVLKRHGVTNPIEVRVRAGCMTGIVPEALEEAFSIAALHTLGCSPRLCIDVVASRATCSECGRQFQTRAFPAWCPSCGGSGLWASGGDELELVSVEVEDGQDDRGEGTHSQEERGCSGAEPG